MSSFQSILAKPTKRRVFVSYHHGRDQAAYDALSRLFAAEFEVFTDRSLDVEIDSDDPSYVYRKIREDNIRGSSVTLVLVGVETWKRKYVDWETYATLDMKHGLAGLAVPSPVGQNAALPSRLSKNFNSKYAGYWTWPKDAASLKWIIEDAVTRSASTGLIVNSDQMMGKNLP